MLSTSAQWSSVHSCLAPGYVYNSKFINMTDSMKLCAYPSEVFWKWIICIFCDLRFIISWSLTPLRLGNSSHGFVHSVKYHCPVVKLKLVYVKILSYYHSSELEASFLLLMSKSSWFLCSIRVFEASLITFDQVSEYTWLSIRFSSV